MDKLLETIPSNKIKQTLLVEQNDVNKQKVIVLSTGSLCPVHLMHFKMMRVAIEHLEKTNKYQVLGGFLSPSQDGYVSTKLGNEAIPPEDRRKMVEIITQEDSKITISPWESLNNGRFIDFPEVVKYHIKYFNQILPTKMPELKDYLPIKVFYVCGSDHALRCSLIHLKRSGVVVVPRPGITQIQREKLNNDYEVTDEELEDISSTKIRNQISNKQSLLDYCGPLVSQYLYDYYNYKP